MDTLGFIERKPFLKEHPVITKRILLTSSGTEQTLLTGTVIGDGTYDDKAVCGPFDTTKCSNPIGILAEDVTVPASGDAWAVIYVHCACVEDALIWESSVTAAVQAQVIKNLRNIGIFVG